MTTYAEAALVSGLSYLATAQQAIAHNLANVQSTAFKRRSPMAQPVESRFHSLLEAEMPTVAYQEATDWSRGNLVPTNEKTHVALESSDFFRVRAANGQVLFTRSGELHVDVDGFLTTGYGHRLLDPTDNEIQLRGDDGNVPPFIIAPNGALTNAETGESLGKSLGVFRVDRPDALTPHGDGCYADSLGQRAVAVPTSALRQGHLEASNVQSINELINMLVVQKTFQATATTLRAVNQLHATFAASLSR
jgi:flagellar basal body rod protein FlgG